MTTVFKNRFFSAIVILLMMANIVTIVLFWWNSHQPPPHKMGMEKQVGPMDFIPVSLNMTKEQTLQWLQLKEEHRASMPLLRANIEQAKDDFFGLAKTELVDDLKMDSIWEKVNNAEKAIHFHTLQHFKTIRKICTPEQKKRFDEIIVQAIKGMPRADRPKEFRRVPPTSSSNEY